MEKRRIKRKRKQKKERKTRDVNSLADFELYGSKAVSLKDNQKKEASGSILQSMLDIFQNSRENGRELSTHARDDT